MSYIRTKHIECLYLLGAHFFFTKVGGEVPKPLDDNIRLHICIDTISDNKDLSTIIKMDRRRRGEERRGEERRREVYGEKPKVAGDGIKFTGGRESLGGGGLL